MISKEILNKIENNENLDRADALSLLAVKALSDDYYRLLSLANSYSRKAFNSKGLIFAQIGLDSQPCSVNCKFCSLSLDCLANSVPQIKTIRETLEQAELLINSGIEDLFLMTTAEFDKETFLEYIRAVREIMPDNMNLVANISDFDLGYALKLKEQGVTGVYHVHRLREGTDTGALPKTRIATMDAIKSAGLTLYYCVEPIGPEHSDEELVDEMLRIKDYPVEVMAVMKRICVPGTPLEKFGEITAARLAQICAVTTLVARPSRGMCVHEPDELCLMSGANQLYAECGINPRDTKTETEKGRGFSVLDAKKMLLNTLWEV